MIQELTIVLIIILGAIFISQRLEPLLEEAIEIERESREARLAAENGFLTIEDMRLSRCH